VADYRTSRLLLEALLPLIRGLNDQRTLSPGKLDVLRRLSATSRSTITDLASSGQVTTQGISLAVRELERMGLVTRSPDHGDRRRVWIDITPEGRVRLESEFAISLRWLQDAIDAQLAPGERAALEAAIPALRQLGSILDHG
jgi:DNA-binding MarR family transcriptional regulator